MCLCLEISNPSCHHEAPRLRDRTQLKVMLEAQRIVSSGARPGLQAAVPTASYKCHVTETQQMCLYSVTVHLDKLSQVNVGLHTSSLQLKQIIRIFRGATVVSDTDLNLARQQLAIIYSQRTSTSDLLACQQVSCPTVMITNP